MLAVFDMVASSVALLSTFGGGLCLTLLDTQGDGWTAEDGDCDDADPSVHPGAAEECDGSDDDCDGRVDSRDPDMPQQGYTDEDGDGYPGTPSWECGATGTLVDCDDADPSIHPGSVDTPCDGVDTDCDSGGRGEIAIVGDRSVATLEDAFLLAEAGEEILVCPGVHLVPPTVVAASDAVLRSYSGSPSDTVLDGDGYDTVLSGDGTLVVRDLTFRNTAELEWSWEMNDGACIEWSGELDIENVAFENCDEVAIQAEYSGSSASDVGIAIRASTFRNNGTLQGYGALSVTLTDGAAVIENSEFSDNTSTCYGGAITSILRGASVRVTGSSFEGNRGPCRGGAIEVSASRGGNSFTILDSSFRGNRGLLGGGVSATAVQDAALVLTIESSRFEQNVSDGAGGGVHGEARGGSSRLDLDLTDIVFDTNNAALGASSSGAGAVHLTADSADTDATSVANLRMVRTEFNNNSALGLCSQMYMDGDGGVASLTDVTVTDGVNDYSENADGIDRGCAVGFFGSDTDIDWSGGSLLRNQGGFYGTLVLGLDDGNTARLDTVAFGTGADENESRDIEECPSNPRVGTITADLDATNPCP